MNVFVRLFAEFNLGDDLFLKILLERYPRVQFVLDARVEYQEAFQNYDNLKVIQTTQLSKGKLEILINKVFKTLQRKTIPAIYRRQLISGLEKRYDAVFKDEFDAFVSIGGSIFMQPKILPAYANIEYYRLINKKFKNKYYLGCNFGPYISEDYKEGFRDIFSKATDVCFRDSYSVNLFQGIKAVRHKPDIVFGMNYKSNIIKRKNTVGFSVISPRNGVDEESYINKYAELIKYYQGKGLEIAMFSFCSKQNDEGTINKIISKLDSQSNIEKVIYHGDMDDFLTSYASVEKMYCGRFHAMILSMLFDQRIFPIIYSDKMTNVLEDIKYSGGKIKMENFHLLDPEKTDRILSKENTYDIKQIKFESEQQFEKLDELLRK